MTYELLSQGPEVYIPALLVSLLLTVIGYGAVPLIVANTRNQQITKRKYRWICYGVNAAIMLGFAIWNGGASNGAPYLLWTSVFSVWGLKILENRGVLEGTKIVEHPDSKLGQEVTADDGSWQCSCGRRNASYVSNCYCGLTKRDVLQSRRVEAGDSNQINFCRKCGQKLLENSRFCIKCGTQVTGGTDDEVR